jgi:hypothetical protein
MVCFEWRAHPIDGLLRSLGVAQLLGPTQTKGPKGSVYLKLNTNRIPALSENALPEKLFHNHQRS